MKRTGEKNCGTLKVGTKKNSNRIFGAWLTVYASTGRNLVLLVRSGPVNRDLGGSVHIWEDNAPVLISYFYDGAAPVEVFQNRSQSGFYMGNLHLY